MTEIADRLREGRAAATTGVLTIDRANAQEKMRLYRLPDPHFYVLQFVRAASMLGAREIEFVVEADTMVCLFDVALLPGSLDDVWNASYALRDTLESGALHNLALGLLSAEALNPECIEIVSGATQLDIAGGRASVYDIPDAPMRPRTKIMVREKFRLGHIPEFFSFFFGELPEVRALRMHCEYSLLDVIVNGRRANTGLPGGTGPCFEGDFEGEALLAVATPAVPQLQFVLLRDDVLIHRTQAPHQMIGATVVMNSHRAKVDLTGLTMREAPAYFEREAWGAYHHVLDQWLTRERVRELSPRALRELLLSVSQLVADLGEEEPARPTRVLLEWLFVQPMLERAFAEGPERFASLRDVITDEQIEFVERRIDLPPDGRAHVLLIHEPELLLGLGQLGIVLEDVTLRLANEARRRRNRLRWEAQPMQSPAREAIPASELIEHGEMVGWIEAHMSEAGSRACRIYLDGRLLRETFADLPFQIELHGGFRPNEYFDNVDRDAAFDELALAVVAAARRLCRFFVEQRATALMVMERFVAGTFESDLLGMLGYGRQQAERLIEHAPALPREDHPLGVPLALFDAPLFDSLVGQRHTLREIVSAETPPVCLDEHEHVGMVEMMLLEQEWSMILSVSLAARRVILAARSDATAFEGALLFEARLNAFLARADFRPRGGKALLEQIVEHDDFTIEARLLDDEGSQVTAYLVWRDRQLALHRWKAIEPGHWQVIVRSEKLRPNPTFDDVLQDDHFREIQQAFAQLSVQMKAQLRASAPVERAEPPIPFDTNVASPEPRRRDPHDVLQRVSDLLREVRAERRDLLSDFSLRAIVWADDDQEQLCRVVATGATVRRDHPVVYAAGASDPTPLTFLASCITTQINAYYREITDADEQTLQRALLRRSLD